jgi:hypothetical protein
MPRYFFHLHNDVDAMDALGEEWPDLAAARAHAIGLVRFEAAESIKQFGRMVLAHRIDIENAKGEVLGQVQFRDAVTIES